MTNFQKYLIDFNPWWKEEFKVDFKPRESYEKIQKFLELRQIIALTGLRRVGKTTIMLKIIEDYLKKINRENIIYFSFDEFKELKIREVISSYEDIFGKKIEDENYLILLDEIQKVEGWEAQIKTIYDLYKNVKIIISGSESLFIRKKSKETLAGRMFEFKIETLSFSEFLKFKEIKVNNLSVYEKELLNLFEKFKKCQGFPELVNIDDEEIISKYVKESIIDKIIYKDIPSLVKIKDVSILEAILRIIMEDPGEIIDISKLASDLNYSRQSISNYLNYLEKSFLIRKLYNFSKSKRKAERKLKKYYPAIVSPYLLFSQENISKSKVFEWIIVSQLNSEFFWRDDYKNEVDIVLANKNIIPIEIKYGKIEFEGINKFINKFKTKENYIISYKEERKEGDIKVMPAYKFLLEFDKN